MIDLLDIPDFLKRRKEGVDYISDTFSSKPVEYEPEPRLLPRPSEATWANAKLYSVRLMDAKYPVCGTRMVWAVVGYKWVRICTPIQHDKFKMRRAEWDALEVCNLVRE
jgi:hypothetical protein